MPENMNVNNNGGLVISEEVLTTIVVNAIKDIEGISSLATQATPAKGPVGFVSSLINQRSGNAANAVKVIMRDNDVKTEVFLNLKAGYKIPEVAEKVQTAVKDAILNMTGKIVSKVDVTVVNIDFTEPNDDE